MKNKEQVAIALGLMCVLLTSSIVVQLNTIKEATKVVGSPFAEEGLKEDVLKWKETYERAYADLINKETELEQAREETSKEDGRTTELRQELDELNKMLGLTEVRGNGLILTVMDNESITGPGISKAIVHDEDLRELVNEFKNTGAEAISINGQRITNTTAITCSGAIITVNGVKLNSPFEIKAIGNVAALNGIKRPRKLSTNNGG